MNQQPAPRDPAGTGADQRWGADLAVPIGPGCNTFARTSDEAASREVLDATSPAQLDELMSAPVVSLDDGELARIGAAADSA